VTWISSWLLMLFAASACNKSPTRDGVVVEALQAQLGGPSGCRVPPMVDDLAVSYFPTVHFVRGRCVAEHGDTANALAATDGDGVIYLLDSRGAFSFLIQRHPPQELDTTTVIDFARTALVMMGLAPLDARVISGPDDLPDSVLEALGRGGHPLPATRLLDTRASAWIASLTLASPDKLSNFWLTVDRNTGAVVQSETTLWERVNIH
jgi:hypothetical protein